MADYHREPGIQRGPLPLPDVHVHSQYAEEAFDIDTKKPGILMVAPSA